MSHQNEQALPFFARYLEGQFCEDLSVEEMNQIQGGLTKLAPVDLGDQKRKPIHPCPTPRPIHTTSKITDLYAPEPYPIFDDTYIATTPLST